MPSKIEVMIGVLEANVQSALLESSISSFTPQFLQLLNGFGDVALN